MTVKIENNTITIVLPIAPRPSKTGKTTIIAGTSGFSPTTAVHNGKPVSIAVNAVVKN